MDAELRKQILPILDVIMSEYGWTLEYTLRLPSDVLLEIYKTIMERKMAHMKLWTKLMGAAVGAGFSGKVDKLDDLFKTSTDSPDTPVDSAAWKAQLKGLWLRLGKSPEEFEKRWASGEKIEM